MYFVNFTLLMVNTIGKHMVNTISHIETQHTLDPACSEGNKVAVSESVQARKMLIRNTVCARTENA